MHWPGGRGSQLRLDGRARDLLTPTSGEPVVLREDEMSAGVSLERTIEDISATPTRRALGRLVGAQAGGGLRRTIDEVLPDERTEGTPLHLLLDDVAGASLIAGFAWSRWTDVWTRDKAGAEELAAAAARYVPRRMEGICAGFRPGSGALTEGGFVNPERRHNVAEVPPLADVGDEIGWHHLESHPEVAMRRARRIDVWNEGDDLVIDAMFRDSCWNPDGSEVAVHEYRLDAAVAARTGLVRSVVAEPRVLPFAECPAAAPNAGRLVGTPVGDLRAAVLDRLRSTDCCTHLNDALRSLAEVPILAAAL